MVIIVLFVSSGIFAAMPVQAVQMAWYNSNWAYRMPLTIDHAKVPGDVTNFPVLVSITSADLTKAATTGNGLVFTAGDGTTKLNHEIELFSVGTGELRAWVKVPAISSSVDTVIYLYYGYNSPNNEQNVSGVWSNGFKMVQHFDAPAMLTDASGNGTNGTEAGGVTATPAQIGNGLHMDGVDDRVVIADNAALNFTNVLTASLWFKTDVTPDLSNGSENGILGKPNDFWTDSFGFYFDLTGKLRFFVNNYTTFAPAATVAATNWMYIVGVYDGSRVRLYVNGVEKNSVALTQAIGVNNKNLNIGRLSTNQYNTDGTFDEVRIANAARSADWIAAEYANQTAPTTFIKKGVEENFEATKYVQISGTTNSLVAGTTQTIILTLKDGTGNTAADFTGDKNVVLSGLGTAPSGNQPTCSDKNATLVPIGTATTITFTSGVGACNLTVYKAETVSLDAVIGSFTSASDPSFDVDLVVTPAAFDSFLVQAPASVAYNQDFTLTTTARDAFYNTVTTTAADAMLVVSSGALNTASIPLTEFTDDGVAITTLQLGGTSVTSPATITVTSAGKSGSTSFVVTGTPVVSAATGGGGNYSSGSGPSTYGVGGPPPEEVLPAATTTPILAPTTTPAIITSTPSIPVPLPIVPVVPPAPRPTTPQPPVRTPVAPTTTKPSSSVPTKIPLQTLVASTAGGKKQIPITLEPGAAGKQQRTMTLTTDNSIDLAMKLVGQVASVRGFVIPATQTDGGVLIGQPGTAATYTFEYTDTDRDGAYTATLPGTVFRHDDTLITVVEYADPLKPREVTEVRVKNLSGSVVDASKQPLAKVFVTLLKKNEATGQFERWAAEDVGRPNPVLTEKTGHYYFAPPAGTYRLEVVKEGYENYVSEPLKIAEGQAVNFDIVLTSKTSRSALSRGIYFLFAKLKELLNK